ncbi:MAG TPA: hypothetical protein VKA00_07010 [Trueperaceae bacterium]|nr:hypothetical protein [Trueperaceae bacterium]
MPDRPGTVFPTRHAASRAWQLALLALLLLVPTATAAGPARLMVLHDDELGDYLVDDLGRAVYVFVDPAHEDDLGAPQSRPTPSCDATCRAVWPPLVTDGGPVAVPSVPGDLIGTIDTEAGIQVTFDGWPLYRYAADRTRGDEKGEGIEPPAAQAFGGAWYLIAPDGSLARSEEDGAPTQAPGSSGGSSGGGGRPGYY